MIDFRITGLVAATFTPMREDGSLNLAQVSPIVEHLIRNGIRALFVCGSTGEGASLSVAERKAVTEAYLRAARKRVPVIVHVGNNSLVDARELAVHARQVGADAISALAPSYFKPASLPILVKCLAEITAGAPDLPFYYYHIPALTGVNFDMVELLQLAEKQLPSLVGIKFTNLPIHEMQLCLETFGGKYNLLFGVDEMLMSGLVAGAHGAVGSTYNFLAPVYWRVIEALKRNDLAEARRWQATATRIVMLIVRTGGQAGLKSTMKFLGLDCGPTRLPIRPLESNEIDALQRELESLDFFNLIRNPAG